MAGRGMGAATRGGGAVESGAKNKRVSETSKTTGPVMMAKGGDAKKKKPKGMMAGGMATKGMAAGGMATKGMAAGGMMSKGYAAGGPVKMTKGMAAGGKR